MLITDLYDQSIRTGTNITLTGQGRDNDPHIISEATVDLSLYACTNVIEAIHEFILEKRAEGTALPRSVFQSFPICMVPEVEVPWESVRELPI
jgi:hypothetical protein